MARRATNGKGYEDFKPFIQFVVKELGLTDNAIVYRFRRATTMGGRAYWRKIVNGKIVSEIIVNTLISKSEMYEVIAHELRHIYQRQNKMLEDTWHNNEWWRVWSGEKHSTVKNENRLFSKLPKQYEKLPWEADANEYAKLAVAKWSSQSKG